MVDEDLPRPEYPRPQFRRTDWINLNGEWHFAFDDKDAGFAERWQAVSPRELGSDGSPFDRRIVVPFCYQAKLSGIGETTFHDVVWYARTFEYTLAGDERVLLHCGAVDYRAKVWVNGMQVACHEGGHTPFSADVTDALIGETGKNVVVVRAEDPSRDVTIPRGKQYWKEKSEDIFYTRTTGIWQTVWLEPVNRRHLERLRLTPDVDTSSIYLEVDVAGLEPGMSLRAKVTFEGEPVVEDTVRLHSSPIEHNLPLLRRGADTSHHSESPDAALWSPEEPNLYDLRLELLDETGGVLDTVESYFGMRKIEVKDGEVFLNDRPLYQRLVLDQGYFPDGILTAPTDNDLRRDVELAREMGFNGARKHQKLEDPRWLYWADTLGLLVWGEMANAYEYTTDYVRRMTAEWQEALARDYNHPCIVAWVPMNESWGVPDLAGDPAQIEHLLALYHLTRSIDGTRPVVSNDGWEHALTDLCTIHDYRDADALRESYRTPESAVAARPARRPVYVAGHGYRDEPILITEFGGIAFSGDQAGWGYSTVADAEEFLARYDSLIKALLQSETVQGFCYTQLTDVEQEANGLLTYDRKPKTSLERIRQITARERDANAGA